MDGASEVDMNTVVSIHNNMNENTWKQILAWENLHNNSTAAATEAVVQPAPAGAATSSASVTSTVVTGTEPKLLRFIGKPNDLSPKARIKM